MVKKKFKGRRSSSYLHIQHEIDHLDGVLFIDYLSKLKKDMIVKKLIKHKKETSKNCFYRINDFENYFYGNT